MNFVRRLVIVLFATFFSFCLQSGRSQVEISPESPAEPPTAEPTPIAQPHEASPEATPEETHKKKPRKKAEPEQTTKVLQDSMTAQEFKSAGLEKLSAEELANLNAWLQGYRQTTETKA